MDAEKEMLCFVYQNSEMGATSIAKLAKHSEDESFLHELADQRREYLCINAAARDALSRLGCDEKGLTALEKLRTYLSIDVQSLVDSSTEHLAEMMLLGSTMGIIDAKKNLRRFCRAEAGEGKKLMRKLCDLEERNVESMKAFL